MITLLDQFPKYKSQSYENPKDSFPFILQILELYWEDYCIMPIKPGQQFSNFSLPQ